MFFFAQNSKISLVLRQSQNNQVFILSGAKFNIYKMLLSINKTNNYRISITILHLFFSRIHQ